MTTDPPAADSAWGRVCPDAYPYDWYAALRLTALPPGFARFATDDEAAVIRGGEPPKPAGRGPPAPPSPAAGGPRPARGDRFATLNGFVDGAMGGLSRSEVAVWLVVFRDVKADTGTAAVSQAAIARRAGVAVRTVQAAVRSLTEKGLLVVVRRGRLGGGPSVYRVRAAGK